jgi:hypothetical protein
MRTASECTGRSHFRSSRLARWEIDPPKIKGSQAGLKPDLRANGKFAIMHAAHIHR